MFEDFTRRIYETDRNYEELLPPEKKELVRYTEKLIRALLSMSPEDFAQLGKDFEQVKKYRAAEAAYAEYVKVHFTEPVFYALSKAEKKLWIKIAETSHKTLGE